MNIFFHPCKIIMGTGCLDKLGSYAKGYGKRVMLVTGKRAMKEMGFTDRCLKNLEAEKLDVLIYDRVMGEPDLDLIQDGIGSARREKIDVVVGLGGGSAIDTAKAIAGLAKQEGKVEEYYDGRSLTEETLPFLAIPTTAGTGAEVTKNAVLLDRRRKIKKSIRDDCWYAKVAFVDPELTIPLPPDITAHTGADALTQAIESYVSIGAIPQTDALASYAIRLISRSLLKAYRNGKDIDARSDMSYGSTLAGVALANAGLGGVHGIAHPLGVLFNISHGLVCGLLLPYLMEYNMDFCLAKYAEVTRLMRPEISGLSDEEGAKESVKIVRGIFEEIGIPSHLEKFGVTPDHFSEIIEGSMPSGSLKRNPRKLSEDDVRVILEGAM